MSVWPRFFRSRPVAEAALPRPSRRAPYLGDILVRCGRARAGGAGGGPRPAARAGRAARPDPPRRRPDLGRRADRRARASRRSIGRIDLDAQPADPALVADGRSLPLPRARGGALAHLRRPAGDRRREPVARRPRRSRPSAARRWRWRPRRRSAGRSPASSGPTMVRRRRGAVPRGPELPDPPRRRLHRSARRPSLAGVAALLVWLPGPLLRLVFLWVLRGPGRDRRPAAPRALRALAEPASAGGDRRGDAARRAPAQAAGLDPRAAEGRGGGRRPASRRARADGLSRAAPRHQARARGRTTPRRSRRSSAPACRRRSRW